MGRLVDAMLRLARADSLPPRNLAPVDLGALAEAVVARRADTSVAISLVEAPGTGPALVQADGEALSVAVSNLVENAVRHAGAEGRVTLSVHRSGSELRLHVDDTGPGVPPAEREVIFLPHRQGQGAQGGAAGLGLAIARRIVEQHGGRLVAAEGPEGGARFTLSLPAA